MEFLNFEGLAYFKNKENSQIAPVESTTTASQAYEIGQYFWYEGKLYEATAAIALGDTFVTSGDSANCELADIADDISDARERIDTLEGQVTDLETNKANIDGYYSEMTVGNAEQIVSTVGVEDKTPYNFRTAGGSVDIGDREEDMVVGGTVAWNQLVTTDTNVSKTKSGDIITVNDAVAGNAEDLVVSFEPQQNLNGYDYPWPGGSGTNKLKTSGLTYAAPSSTAFSNATARTFTENSYTTGVSANNYCQDNKVSGITVSENFVQFTTIARAYGVSIPIIGLTVGSAYTLSASIVDGVFALGFYEQDGTFISNTNGSNSGSLTATIPEGTYYTLVAFAASADNGQATFTDIQLELGQSASPYKPYSNICPITGFTGASIERTKTNVFPLAINIDDSSYGHTYRIVENPALAEFFSFLNRNRGNKIFYSANVSGSAVGVSVGHMKIYDYASSDPLYNLEPNYSSTVPDKDFSGADYVVIYGSTSGATISNVQIEPGESASPYEAFDGTSYPVSWQTEAGTVYGGTWNPVAGKLTKTYGRFSASGSTLWRMASDSYIGETVSRVYYPTGIRKNNSLPLYCNMMPHKNLGLDYGYMLDGLELTHFYLPNTLTGIVKGVDTLETAKEKFNTYFAAHPLEFLWVMETPVEYDLTPQQIALLAGTNNVWNTIGSTQMTYLGTLNEITAQSGHKYLTRVNGVSTVVNGAGQTLSGEKDRDNIFDLTQMFGSSIADYVYSLENTSAGDGVTWFTDLFPKPYYSYNAGQLMSVNTSAHKTVGFNAYDHSAGTAKVVDGMEYQITGAYTALSLNGETVTPDASGYFIPDNTGVLTVTGGNSTTTCIHLVWDGERDGEYEEYEEHTYALDSSLTLRGIPKLDSGNKLYYDGDTYEDDGTVTRKYGIVDLGTMDWSIYGSYNITRFHTDGIKSLILKPSSVYVLPNVICQIYTTITQAATWNQEHVLSVTTGGDIYIMNGDYTTSSAFKSAMSGIYLVYELVTPTTEEADPYTNPQIVNDFGTEEYVDYSVLNNEREVSIPVGHVTTYQANLRAKLEMAPQSPDGDGDYIVRQSNGVNEYVQLVIPEELPESPTSNGTYILQATVSGGTTTLAWVSAT